MANRSDEIAAVEESSEPQGMHCCSQKSFLPWVLATQSICVLHNNQAYLGYGEGRLFLYPKDFLPHLTQIQAQIDAEAQQKLQSRHRCGLIYRQIYL